MKQISDIRILKLEEITDFAEDKDRKIDNISKIFFEYLYKNQDWKEEIVEICELFKDILQSENITVFSLINCIFFKDGFYTKLPQNKKFELKKIIEDVFCSLLKGRRIYKKDNYFLDNQWLDRDIHGDIKDILYLFKDRVPLNTIKTRRFFLSFMDERKKSNAFNAKENAREKNLRDINFKNQMEYELLKLMEKYDRLKNF